MAEEGPGVASDDGGLVIGGIPLDPSSHTILQYAGGDEGAAADLAAAINTLTGRVMHAVPDIAWIRNVGFHDLDFASGTTARIPLAVGPVSGVWAKIGYEAEAVPDEAEAVAIIKTVGPSLVIHGTTDVVTRCAVAWFIRDALTPSDGKQATIDELDLRHVLDADAVAALPALDAQADAFADAVADW